MSKRRCTPEQFCDLARESSTIQELARKANIAVTSARARIYQYRKRGVPVKLLYTESVKPSVDWKALASRERTAQKGTSRARRAKKSGKS